MPCEDSKMEDNDKPTTTTVNGRVAPVFNLMHPQTEIPARDDGPVFGDDLVVTTYVTVTVDPRTDVETVTHTITLTTGMEQGTVTVTMLPSTLATVPALGSQPQTVTATVTALPPGRVCTTIGTAVGGPIACFFGAGAFILGIYMWFQRKKNRDEKHRRDSATAALAISDGSSDDPTAPLPYARTRGRHGIDGGSGIMAPPPSLDTHPDGPFADSSSPRYSHTPVYTVHHETANESGNIRSQRASYVSSYSGVGPQSSPGSDTTQTPRRDGYPRRSNSITTVLSDSTNGEIDRVPRRRIPMNDGEVATFENGSAGRTRFPNQLRTVVYDPPADGSGDVGSLLRPIGGGYDIQNASIIDDPRFITPPHSRSLAVSGAQESVELGSGPVPRGLSFTDRTKAEGGISKGEDDDDDALHLGNDGPFELSADSPIHELGTDGAIVTHAKSDQNNDDGKNADESDGGQDDGATNGDRVGRRPESPATQ